MPGYVAECIGSVLRQTMPDFEIIVVDDASTIDVETSIKQFNDTRVKYIRRETNGGVTAAVNTGLKAATGNYVCPLGCDDLLMPWMIEKQSTYLDEHKDIAAVFGLPVAMTDEGVPIESDGGRFHCPANRTRLEWLATLLEGNCLMGQTMLYRRELHDTLGYWDETLGAANDIDWFIRIVKEHDIFVQHIPMAVVRIRQNDKTQLSADTTGNRKLFFRDLKYIREKHNVGLPKSGFEGKLIIAASTRGGSVPSTFVDSLLASTRCLEKLGIEWDVWFYDAGIERERAKNAVCARFLESTGTDLFFIDSMLEWNPIGFLRIVLNDEEVVGGSVKIGASWSAKPLIKNGIPQGVMSGDSVLLKAKSLSSIFLRLKKSALLKFREQYQSLQYYDEFCGLAKDYLCTSFFEVSTCGKTYLTGDETFCERWDGDLWIEPQVEFKTATSSITTTSLDQYYRELKQTQLKAA